MSYCFSVFFNDTATTEIYTLSLHDALPIFELVEIGSRIQTQVQSEMERGQREYFLRQQLRRSEEHTSELQSRQYLVCRLLLEKKKIQITLNSRWRFLPEGHRILQLFCVLVL